MLQRNIAPIARRLTLTRRAPLSRVVVAGAVIALAPALLAGQSPAQLSNQKVRNMENITFKNGSITMAGNLHLPEGFKS